MKIQSGKSYITADGRSTGILKVNAGAAITFPYYSPELKVEYSETGRANIGGAINKGSRWDILEPEYTTTMIADNPDSDIVSEVARLKEENEAMRTALKQNVKSLIEFKKVMESLKHKLPRELREFLNQ